jgi:acetyl esterase
VLHPQAEAAAALWALEPSPGSPGFDVDVRRALSRDLARDASREDVQVVQDLDVEGVPCRLYRPREGAGVLVALHGGGFVLGDLDTHDPHWRRVANRTGWAVLAVHYRRAPEHLYPAASDDVDTAIGWIRDQAGALDVDSARVALVGDSAGGQLALVAALRNHGLAALALVYPCVDPSGAQPSYRCEVGGLTAAEMDWYWKTYLGGQERHPELDLLNADLRGLPPTWLLTAEHDPLRDEAELLARRIATAGVSVTATRYLGMIHGFWRWPELFDAADLATGQLGAFLAGVAPTGSISG